MTQAKRLRRPQISSDHALGAFGCSLAVAAASFGLYMNLRGPSSPTGTSHDFTIFAQLAPRQNVNRTHGPSTSDETLDIAATASIPRPTETADKPATGALAVDAALDKPPSGEDETPAAESILTGIVLTAAADDAAEVSINGQTEKVRVGDTIPGAGEVLAILPGRRPILKTSLGLIVAPR